MYRHLDEELDVILINDASNDGYNYKSVADKYGALYIENEERIGVAESRDKGVELCQTPYFLLLDAHMRFYDHTWLNRVIEELEKAYAFEVDASAKIYLNSMNKYIVDKKSALVYASWVAFCVKQSMLQLYLLTKPIITADLLKVIPMLSKQLMIFIWSATIENFEYDKQTYKSSLIFHNYATSESDLSLT
jgi:glycosyltransferase involved in cell wall biosynthesis